MTMPRDLKDYVKFYDVLTKEECKNITSKLKKVKTWKMHSYHDVSTNTDISYEDDLSVCYELEEEKKMLMDKLWHSINRYIRTDMDFCGQWFNNWSGYSPLRWNRYNVGTNMKIHCDHISTLFDGNIKGIPTLTILGALNNNYRGGELIFWGDEEIKLEIGQVMIFPSTFMYPHQVNTITKGTRYSFVSWVW